LAAARDAILKQQRAHRQPGAAQTEIGKERTAIIGSQ
jgi:hypothetical protein